MAGVGWDANLVRFGRQLLQAQWCAALGGGAVLSLTGGLGLTLPWGHAWRSSQTCISDRSARAPSRSLLAAQLCSFQAFQARD